MAGNTVNDMTTNFGKLDKFEGHDFRRWQKKMHFLLTTLKVVYVLTTPMPELLEDETVEAIRIRAKWENDDYICMGHILNGMSDSLFDVYTNVESAKELWDSLKSKYMAEDFSSKKFLVSNFNNYKTVDSRPIMKQYNELLRILGQYIQHGLKMDESISVSNESLRAQDSDMGKGKEVGGPSVNMTEEGGKNKHHKQNKGKKWSNENSSGSNSNKKPKLECWKCGKTGHFKRDFRSGKKNNANVGGSRKGSKDPSQDQDSCATTHVCNDRYWFKTYEPVDDGSVLYMGDDHFASVHGKGSVALEFSYGKTITLFNVLYVPKLCKNLVSGPMLNKFGYKHVYESDKYILSKSGVFVGFGYYNNGIIHETTAPYIPQQNSVAERKNRAPKEMGCRAVVRLPDPKRKTLGENESRYAILDEKRFSSIPRPKDIIPNVQESQMDDHTDDVPNEIPEPREAIDDEIGSIIENNTWVLSDLPHGYKPFGCKWIFKRKMKVDETINKFKARLVIQSFRQKEGIDYFDTYAPVARMTTIRLLLALAAIHNLLIHQMDVKIEFLNGGLDEEVYMKQPKGFVMPSNEHKVYKLVKSLYGLKQAPKQWHQKFDEIKHENKGIVITQSHYIKKILKKFNREDCSPVSTPMDRVEKLKPDTGKPVDQLEYSRAIGCLMYAMISTRPDIAYAVSRLSRFTSNPNRQHWKAITRVFKYLRGTKDYGLSYVGYPLVLEGAISWASKKQTCITGSTMEYEFVALAAAGVNGAAPPCRVKGQRPFRGQGAEPLAGVPLPGQPAGVEGGRPSLGSGGNDPSGVQGSVPTQTVYLVLQGSKGLISRTFRGSSPLLEGPVIEGHSGDREESSPLTKERIEGYISALKSLIKDHNKKNAIDPIRLNFETKDVEAGGSEIAKWNTVKDVDIKKPFKETLRTPPTLRIINFEWILQESREKSQKPDNNGHNNRKNNDTLAIRVKLDFDLRDEIYGMENEIDQMAEIKD
nr:zinc finger, CCHC-type [Tanacetum cinerariifolium]